MMKNAHSLLLAGSLTLLAGTVLAQDAATKPHVPLQKTVGQVSQQAPIASLLPGAQANAKLEGDKLVVRIAGLPAAWQGQALEAFPETAGVLQNAAKPETA